MTGTNDLGRQPTDIESTMVRGFRVTTRTAQNLADALGRLRFAGLDARGGTRLVTRAVAEWAESLGWMPVTEMSFEWLLDTEDAPGRQGIIDLYVARPGYKTDLAIEIDRSNKVWSAIKLRHAVEHGMSAIWIRWSGREPLETIVAPGVEVIYVSAERAPRVEPAITDDTRLVPKGQSLSASSRVLLAALFPDGPPVEDPGWLQEDQIWAYVDEMTKRRALILRCRFGQYDGHAMTLARTAEVVADTLNGNEVTRERIRQVQNQSLRMLRTRTTRRIRKWARERETLAGGGGGVAKPSDPTARDAPRRQPRPKRPPRREPAAPVDVAIDLGHLQSLVVDITRCVGRSGVSATMIGHVLRGSSGPATRALVARHDVPHDGAMSGVPYRPLRDAILAIAAEPPLQVRDNIVTLVR